MGNYMNDQRKLMKLTPAFKEKFFENKHIE